MRFAAYTHRHHTQVAVVENDTLYPLPGVRSLTEIIARGEGPEALLDAGAAALDVPPGRRSPRCACCLRSSPPPYGTS